MTRLAPCPSCNRHVRIDEINCPFCESTLGDSLRARPSVATAGLKRAAVFALGATLTTAACGDEDDSNSNVAQQQQGSGGKGTSGNTGGSAANAGGTSPGIDMGTGGDLPLPQPVYGAPIVPDPVGTGGSGGSSGEMETDAGAADPEPAPTIQPLYGGVPAPQQDG